MALRESGRQWLSVFSKPAVRPTSLAPNTNGQRRWATTRSHFKDLESNSSFNTPPASADVIKGYNPIARSAARKGQLPRSGYQYRSPKHYRGPLHPHQPPPKSDPASREFIPGPFTYPRLEQTYHSTIAHDILAMEYVHFPPGQASPDHTQRLRRWEGDSPYFANRSPRMPRGGRRLKLVKRPTTFRTIPKVERVTVHSFVPAAADDSAFLHVAGMAIQAITGVRVESHQSKRSVSQWGLRAGKYVAVTADITGEDMYDFISKTVHMVLPKIKDWKGISVVSGDHSGNVSFGLKPEAVAFYPEIEVNYDMYPAKMIPGCHITIHTSATTDKQARNLLSAIGMPYEGTLKRYT
ncbi:50S ribosomal subunit L7 [Eremomyces bilateralis CBS 781.70]|uniref:Large ribosomal subunit protein uL5m n=1 Tax=Eremomyces bilateralis CBS 781.70 TaxID=1392243 RepID=A0A6G1G6P7_9PEZI|nr:50S ribosomal subunit L7 [Eremomyces bilateralis CBS 781.70]KAF1813509.1 50S ribosomal subunit L7 [Eremomyces bilateralis CBS 781.70]